MFVPADLRSSDISRHKETFRTTVYTKFFAKCVASQDLFKQFPGTNCKCSVMFSGLRSEVPTFPNLQF